VGQSRGEWKGGNGGERERDRERGMHQLLSMNSFDSITMNSQTFDWGISKFGRKELEDL